MDGASVTIALRDLRDILRAAIQICRSLSHPPEAIQAAIDSYYSSCFSIDVVIDIVESTTDLHKSAAKDSRLLKYHIEAAQNSLERIRDVVSRCSHLVLTPVPKLRRSNVSSVILSSLSDIAAAIHAAVLLVSV